MLKEVCKSMVALALLAFSPFCLVGCGDDDDNIEEGIQGGGSNDDGTRNNTYQISDLVGTWEIVHSQYTRRENGVVTESRNEDVSDEHNRFVFYSDGRVEFLEYSDTQGTWHEDGKGTFYLRNGNIVFMGDFKDVSILSLSKAKLVLKYKFMDDKGGTIVEKEYVDTMERIDDNSGNVDGTYTMSDLVGTWEGVHCKEQYKDRNGNVITENEYDFGYGSVYGSPTRKSFHSDGSFECYEKNGGNDWEIYKGGSFSLSNGKYIFYSYSGSFKEKSEIISLSKTEFIEKDTVMHDIIYLSGTRYTNVVCERTIVNKAVDGTGGTGYTMSDLVGTWEIVHSQYTYRENGVVVESGSEDVSDDHNRFVFYSNGTFEFLEYSDTQGTWHEDGKGTFYLRNGQFVFTGDIEEASILSLTKTTLVAKYKFVEDKGETIYEDEYIDTMERITN